MVVPVQSEYWTGDVCAREIRHCLEPCVERLAGHVPRGAGIRVETGELQLPVLLRRAASHSALADRSGGYRRRRSRPAFLRNCVAVVVANEFLPVDRERGLRLLRYLPGHRCGNRRRPCAIHEDPHLQDLCRRFPGPRYRQFRRAVRRADGDRGGADRRAIPFH
ncbi:Glycerol-3-phosphate ABC transporter, permease protein UgpE [Caballeronia sordidicola]|uniref:Glycerol-3-phosphate ABC transporter, permease protein UgpE n=1 Tax=Caballeronia sordidicola TaxID=196367 RepID=A0A242M8Q6_CABSO|nr:Glycerol-3-phosphate ABC transporter, permease protein UgpE [Caballeronia sordidicola]